MGSVNPAGQGKGWREKGLWSMGFTEDYIHGNVALGKQEIKYFY